MADSFFSSYIKAGEEASRHIGPPGIHLNKPYRAAQAGLGDVGIELEFEGRSLPTAGHLGHIVAPKTNAMWNAHPDGSLRGENQEYVLISPCNIDEVEHMVTSLYKVFTDVGSRLDCNNRTSTHIHANIQGLKLNEITSIIGLWTTFEECFLPWCGEDRINNHFCITAKGCTANIEKWGTLLEKGKVSGGFEEGDKYTSMNLRPIFTQGSIEFRTMGARPEPKQIIQWAHLTHHLKRFACERYANPCLIANDLSERGGRSILIDICSRDKTWMGDELAAEFFRAPSNEDFDRKCLEGFRRAQYVINGFPWYEWMPEIEKVYVPNPFSESKKKAKSTYEINRIEDFDVAVAPREGPRFRIRPVLEDDEVEPEPDVEEWIAGDEPQDNPPREPPQAPREGEWRDPLAPEERLHRAMNEDAARLANNRGRINDLNWELLNRRRGVRALGDF